MRPFPQTNEKRFRGVRIPLVTLLTAGTWMFGCGGGGAGSPPPPPPPSIVVTVTPKSGSVVLGNQVNFTATVTNTTDRSVAWNVNGIAGGNASVGTITLAGVYTAPVDLPSPATVQVTATSQADSTKSDNASLTISSDIMLPLAPSSASVELGATKAFQSNVTSSGHPDASVRWSLSRAACTINCGMVDTNGNYTAPGVLPSPASVTLTAQSVADPWKQVSASVASISSFTLQLAAPSSVPVSGSVQRRRRSIPDQRRRILALSQCRHGCGVAAAAGMRGACGGDEFHDATAARTLKKAFSFQSSLLSSWDLSLWFLVIGSWTWRFRTGACRMASARNSM